MHVERVMELSLSDKQIAKMIRAFKWSKASVCPRRDLANVKGNGKSDKRFSLKA